MKNLTIIGLILLGLATALFFTIPQFNVVKLLEPTTLMGILAGVGIGLIMGGIVGYISKGSSIKNDRKKKEMLQLKKEKEALEKQAAELAAQHMKQNSTDSEAKK